MKYKKVLNNVQITNLSDIPRLRESVAASPKRTSPKSKSRTRSQSPTKKISQSFGNLSPYGTLRSVAQPNIHATFIQPLEITNYSKNSAIRDAAAAVAARRGFTPQKSASPNKKSPKKKNEYSPKAKSPKKTNSRNISPIEVTRFASINPLSPSHQSPLNNIPKPSSLHAQHSPPHYVPVQFSPPIHIFSQAGSRQLNQNHASPSTATNHPDGGFPPTVCVSPARTGEASPEVLLVPYSTLLLSPSRQAKQDGVDTDKHSTELQYLDDLVATVKLHRLSSPSVPFNFFPPLNSSPSPPSHPVLAVQNACLQRTLSDALFRLSQEFAVRDELEKEARSSAKFLLEAAEIIQSLRSKLELNAQILKETKLQLSEEKRLSPQSDSEVQQYVLAIQPSTAEILPPSANHAFDSQLNLNNRASSSGSPLGDKINEASAQKSASCHCAASYVSAVDLTALRYEHEKLKTENHANSTRFAVSQARLETELSLTRAQRDEIRERESDLKIQLKEAQQRLLHVSLHAISHAASNKTHEAEKEEELMQDLEELARIAEGVRISLLQNISLARTSHVSLSSLSRTVHEANAFLTKILSGEELEAMAMGLSALLEVLQAQDVTGQQQKLECQSLVLARLVDGLNAVLARGGEERGGKVTFRPAVETRNHVDDERRTQNNPGQENGLNVNLSKTMQSNADSFKMTYINPDALQQLGQKNAPGNNGGAMNPDYSLPMNVNAMFHQNVPFNNISPSHHSLSLYKPGLMGDNSNTFDLRGGMAPVVVDQTSHYSNNSQTNIHIVNKNDSHPHLRSNSVSNYGSRQSAGEIRHVHRNQQSPVHSQLQLEFNNNSSIPLDMDSFYETRSAPLHHNLQHQYNHNEIHNVHDNSVYYNSGREPSNQINMVKRNSNINREDEFDLSSPPAGLVSELKQHYSSRIIKKNIGD